MPHKLLVADHAPAWLLAVERILQQRGHWVEVVHTGLTALHRARTLLPDLVVLGLSLPDLDGCSVCEILRCQPSTCRTPVLVVGEGLDETLRLRSLRAGATECFSKSSHLPELIEQVEQVLAMHYLTAPRSTLDEVLDYAERFIAQNARAVWTPARQKFVADRAPRKVG